MLHVDLPTADDLADLATRRNDIGVSIFLPTTPVSTERDGARILLKNLVKDAVTQLEAAGADKRRVGALVEELDDLVDDDEFWRFQAHGLVIYATPDNLRTFRVPNALEPMVKVSDRFHLKPLLRSVTFCNVGYVLALADGGVRLIEVSADLPATEVKVEGMPTDLARAARAATFGVVQSLLVDMDQVVNGTVDEGDGTVRLADGPCADTYGVVDEVARRVLLSGGAVWSVRQGDIPKGKPRAAILRYAL